MPSVRATLRLRDKVGDSMTMIQYHTSGDFQNEVGKGRARYYSQQGLPMDVYVDGDCKTGGMDKVTYEEACEYFDERMNLPPEVEINLSKEYSMSTGEGTVTANIENLSSKAKVDGTCHFAICQRDSVHTWGSPYNEDTCYAVCFKMLPDYNGTEISIAAGGTEEVTQSFTISSSWQRDDCYLTVFVQNNDKEIVQAVEIPLDGATEIQPHMMNVNDGAKNLFSFKVHQHKKSISVRLNCNNAVISIVNCAGVLQTREQGTKRYAYLPLQNLSSGMYFCVVQAGGYREEKKFLLF